MYVALKGDKARLQCLQPDLPGVCLGRAGGGVLGPERPLGRHPTAALAASGMCETRGGASPSLPLPSLQHNRQINVLPTPFLVRMFCSKLAYSPELASQAPPPFF